VGLLAVAVVALAPSLAWAQSNVATGQIFGSVADPDGAAMPGVSIAASNPDTGFTRRTITDASGFYRIDLLPSGNYDVRADLTGFKSEIKRGVNVTLGSAVGVNFALQLTAIEEEIVVTAESPVVEVTNPSVSAAVSDQAIANLPLQGRDFTDFVLLTPGTVFGGDQVADGRGGLNIGARGIQNSFNIDGANSQSSFFGEERGGTRPPFTFSQSAIKEMQVIKSDYGLQFSATGGVINAITKSGTNEFHGEVFGYFTDDSLTDKDAFGRKEDSEQLQYGFALGGPLTRDKLHFFTSVDTQDLEEPQFTNFLDFPAGREADFEALTGLNYETEATTYGRTNDALVWMFKLDWQLGQDNLGTLRYNYSDQEGVNQTAIGYETTGLSNNGLEGNSFDSLVLTLNSVLSDKAFNEAFVQYAFEERPRAANITAIPEAQVWPYLGLWGQNQFLPNFLDEERYQLVDNFTYYAGNHTLRAGINFDMVTFDDGFCRLCNGAYSFNEWEGEEEGFLDGGTPYSYTQAFSDYDGEVEYDTDYYAVYLQDDWRASPNLTVTYGLRYDYQKADQPKETNPLWPDTGQIPNDDDNYSLRAGFAWDIKGDGKQVLRGGLGRFYDNTPTLLHANAMLANGVRVVRVSAYCLYGGDCPTYPDRWASLGDLEAAVGDIFVFDPAFENPETDRISIGYEAEVVRDLSLGIDVIYYETEKLQRKQDQNLELTGETTLDGRPVYEDGNLYPDFDQIIQFNSDCKAEYTAIVLKARKRFSNNWFLDASYTWSEALDNNSNERSVSSSGVFPEDQYNLAGDWGPSDFDVEHKFVTSFSWQLPYNFLVSAIGTYRSGYPFSAGEGHDHNGDGYRNERALLENGFHYGRNTERQPSAKNLDLRLSWTARLGNQLELEFIGEAFNITNEDNLWSSSSRQELTDEFEIDDSFGERDRAGDPRRYQLGMKLRF
jgi:outer membrane receptor protein involved in Fe transport